MKATLRWRTITGLVVAGNLLIVSNHETAAQRRVATPSHPDDRTIQHVLNRIAFGPRPGDIERVRALGLDNYIEQQLNPARVTDAALETRLAQFPTLSMSSRELSEKYF